MDALQWDNIPDVSASFLTNLAGSGLPARTGPVGDSVDLDDAFAWLRNNNPDLETVDFNTLAS